MARILGSEVQVGDTLDDLWFSPSRRDTVTELRPYTGPLAELAGARIASFALNKTGMTIEAGALFTLAHRVAA